MRRDGGNTKYCKLVQSSPKAGHIEVDGQIELYKVDLCLTMALHPIVPRSEEIVKQINLERL